LIEFVVVDTRQADTLQADTCICIYIYVRFLILI